MAILSELVKLVAEVEGLDETSVGIFARAAREAGLISQRGRGPSAARMTTRDVANLIIAVNASALAKNVPEVVPAVRRMKSVRYHAEFQSGLERLRSLSFGEALETLLESCRSQKDGTLPLDAFLAEPFSQ